MGGGVGQNVHVLYWLVRLSHYLGGWGGAKYPCILLVSEVLPLLGGVGGGAECPCIELVSKALPLHCGVGQNVHVLN